MLICGGYSTGPCFSPARHARTPTDPSASSWQGLLMAPEGAPTPPERSCCVTSPGRRTSSRLYVRLEKRPSSGRGGAECKCDLERGDKLPPPERGEVGLTGSQAGWGSSSEPLQFKRDQLLHAIEVIPNVFVEKSNDVNALTV